jgi:hypothetical protein
MHGEQLSGWLLRSALDTAVNDHALDGGDCTLVVGEAELFAALGNGKGAEAMKTALTTLYARSEFNWAGEPIKILANRGLGPGPDGPDEHSYDIRYQRLDGS